MVPPKRKEKSKLLLWLLLGGVGFGTAFALTSKKTTTTSDVLGCTDLSADNFNPLATKDDSSCTYSHYECQSGKCVKLPGKGDTQPQCSAKCGGTVCNDPSAENFNNKELCTFTNFNCSAGKCESNTGQLTKKDNQTQCQTKCGGVLCDINNPALCKDQISCANAGNFWWSDNTCHNVAECTVNQECACADGTKVVTKQCIGGVFVSTNQSCPANCPLPPPQKFSVTVQSNLTEYSVTIKGNGFNDLYEFSFAGGTWLGYKNTLFNKYPTGNYTVFVSPGTTKSPLFKTGWQPPSVKNVNLNQDVLVKAFCSPKVLVVANIGLGGNNDDFIRSKKLITDINNLYTQFGEGAYKVTTVDGNVFQANPVTGLSSYDQLHDIYLFNFAIIFIVGGPCTYDSAWYFKKQKYDCCAPNSGNCGVAFQTGIWNMLNTNGDWTFSSPASLQNPLNWVQESQPLNKLGVPYLVGSAAQLYSIATWLGGVDTTQAIIEVVSNISNYYNGLDGINFQKGVVYSPNAPTIPEKGS